MSDNLESFKLWADDYAHGFHDSPPLVAARMWEKDRAEADAARRRLLVKLCRERSANRSAEYAEHNYHPGEAVAGWCLDIASAIESNQPLTYFERLGSEK